jgi:hypothetical protein
MLIAIALTVLPLAFLWVLVKLLPTWPAKTEPRAVAAG